MVSLSSFDQLRMYPSTSSGCTLRQAQDVPFDKLRMVMVSAHGEPVVLRQAQDVPFGKLRMYPSTSSGCTLRPAQDGHGERSW